MATYCQENHTSMNSLDLRLAAKITKQQELEDEIRGAKFELEYTKFEIGNIKDKIIYELENQIEETRQQVEDLQEKIRN